MAPYGLMSRDCTVSELFLILNRVHLSAVMSRLPVAAFLRHGQGFAG